ncbi:MAG: type II secretion system F family protein [Rickettsiales bacterium]
MISGQPLNFTALLPFGLTENDFYTAITAVLAFLTIWSIGKAFFIRDRLGPRMKAIQERRQEMKNELLAQRKRKKPQKNTDWMRSIVTRLQILKKSQADAVSMKLIQAGYRTKDAIIVYAFAKLTLPFICLAIGAILSDMNWRNPFAETDFWKWLIVVGAGFIGARLPDIMVTNMKLKRSDKIRKSLADTLDLMLICAEAGLSLVAALDRVARELGQAYPEMAEELSLTSVEIGFLPDRNTALKHFAERVDLQEVRSMVNVLLQTEKYGTPIAQALRVLSREFRTQRMLRAEQKAAKLPAIMTVPMIIFILPTLFVIVMTPAMIGVMDAF